MASSSTIPLYSMPPEIWLNVLAHLSEPDFLALKLSSAHLHTVITDNAPTICNTLILTRYAHEASIIGTAYLDGWLVPTHPSIYREENQLARYHSRNSSRAGSRDSTPPPESSFSDLNPVRTKLSEPGPQYLRYLIEYSFEIRVANSMFIENPPVATAENGRCASRAEDWETPHDKFDSWIGLYTVRRFLTRLQRIAGGRAGLGNSFGYGSQGLQEQECAMVKRTRDGLEWFYR